MIEIMRARLARYDSCAVKTMILDDALFGPFTLLFEHGLLVVEDSARDRNTTVGTLRLSQCMLTATPSTSPFKVQWTARWWLRLVTPECRTTFLQVSLPDLMARFH
jgi:hypothetical protein